MHISFISGTVGFATIFLSINLHTMATRSYFNTTHSMSLCVACFFVLTVLLVLPMMENEIIKRDWRLPSDKMLQPHFKKEPLARRSENTREELIHTSSHELLPRRIAIVSMPEWKENLTKLPRKILCDGLQYPVILERANLSNIYSLNFADILLFTGSRIDPDSWLRLQRHRQRKQLWILSTAESPFNIRGAIPPRHLNSIKFNLTSTYHSHSSINVPYGKFECRDDLVTSQDQRRTSFPPNLFYQKEKLIVWVSSHCVTHNWRRYDFVRDLAKLIPLDTYGECGDLSCLKRENCNDIFGKYKFFVSFENACCGEYITEKFWNALSTFDAIPVVLGARKSDYEKQAPRNSFVHVDDFGSMKDLAEYILRVAEDKELYESYFKWRVFNESCIRQNRFLDIMADSDAGVCRLVDYLRSRQFQSDEGNEKVDKLRPFDPYGPNWLGGCDQCGEHNWIRNYSKLENGVA